MADIYRTGNYYAGGIAREATPGTFVSTSTPGAYVYLPYSKLDFDPGITDEPLKAHTGRRGSEYKMMRTKAEPKGSLEMPAWPENGLEHAFLGAIGTVTSTLQGSGATLHTFAESNSLPTFSIIKWAGGGIGEPEAYAGCMVNSLKLDYASGSPVNMGVEYLTSNVDFSQTVPSSFSYASADPFTFNDFICKLGAYGTFAVTATTDVDTTADTITKTSHGMITGDAVTLAGTLPSPLVATTTYYVIFVDANKFKLAASKANASAGTAIDLTTTGSGSISIAKTVSQETTVTKASIEIKNNIDALRTANGKMDPSIKIPGQLEITGRIEFPFKNLDEYRRYLGGSGAANTVDDIVTDRTITLELTGANIGSTYNYDLTINLPRVNLINLKPDGSSDDPIMYGFDFRALYDSVTSKMISATVTSKLASIPQN